MNNALAETTTRQAAQSGPAILRPRDVKALLAAPDRRTTKGRRDAALLAVLVGSGARIGEAVRLVVDNVVFENGRCHVTLKTSKQRSGSPPKWRCVTLPPMAAKLLRDWLDYARPRLFVFGGPRHEAISTRQGRRIVTRYLRQAGRPDLHCHSLRHTVGAQIVRATGSIYSAQRVLGHSSPAVTSAYYACFDVRDADEVADALAGVWQPRKFKGGK